MADWIDEFSIMFEWSFFWCFLPNVSAFPTLDIPFVLCCTFFYYYRFVVVLAAKSCLTPLRIRGL